MKRTLARLLGAHRPKVIAVFGATRAEVAAAVAHASAGATGLPVHAYCEEVSGPVPGCAQFACGSQFNAFKSGLDRCWPALSIVAWTGGDGSTALKLYPFSRFPLRILIMNEAGDFFSASPASLFGHLSRRLRDFLTATVRRVSEVAAASPQAVLSAAHRNAQRLRDLFLMAWSAIYRYAERLRDLVLLAWSALFRCGQLVSNLAGLSWSLTWRGAERTRDLIRLGLAHLYQLKLRSGELLSGLRLWAGEVLISGLAVAAERLPAPSLPVLRTPVGRRSLRPAANESFVEVRIPGRAWHRRKVAAVISSSTASFVVFRWGTETADARPLIETAILENAFAVARQSSWSAWRHCLLAKHPFRRLQPGEVSEVYAPFSFLIAIRRDALASLGLPQALTYGAALMMIFMRSSAAGWKNLVASHQGQITDEPFMCLEDAEVALRASRSRWTMAPPAPQLLRGNISRLAGRCVSSSHNKPRVLVVSPYLPFPLSHGGAVRIYNLCREMANEVDFVLACFREAGETVCYDELHQVFCEVYIVDSDQKSIDSAVPHQVAGYRSSAMSSLIHSFCLTNSVDLVQLEYTQMGEYSADTGRVPVVLVEHDITFTLYSQLATLSGDREAQREAGRWLDFERRALQCSNAVWTMSPGDQKLAHQYGAPARHTYVIPNGVDLIRFRPAPEPQGAPTVLFIGSFRHLPNLLAFEALREVIMPAVWSERPETILRVIAGPNHESAAERAHKAHLLEPDPRIVLTGYESDVRPAYRAANVVVIPLPVSAGTNIKLMEAMASGRAVVSTPVGCHGLDLVHGSDLWMAEPGETFAEAVLTLLVQPALRSRIAAHARQTAEQHFGWNAIARDALESYSHLLGTRVRSYARSDAAD